MRGRMNDAESYADPVALNAVMVGGSVCRVEESNHNDFKKVIGLLLLVAGKIIAL